MPADAFDGCALTVAYASALGADPSGAAQKLSEQYAGAFRDTGLDPEFAQAADLVLKFLSDEFKGHKQAEKTASACKTLTRAVMNFYPDGKRRRTLFRALMFAGQKKHLERRVESSFQRIMTYHVMILNGQIDPRSL